jgi:hypothetical protein
MISGIEIESSRSFAPTKVAVTFADRPVDLGYVIDNLVQPSPAEEFLPVLPGDRIKGCAALAVSRLFLHRSLPRQ